MTLPVFQCAKNLQQRMHISFLANSELNFVLGRSSRIKREVDPCSWLNFAISQVKKKILEEEIHCPPEASVLLASYAVHAKVSFSLENCILSQILLFIDLPSYHQCVFLVCFINLDLTSPCGNPITPTRLFFVFFEGLKLWGVVNSFYIVSII